jgi:hypothetical protein
MSPEMKIYFHFFYGETTLWSAELLKVKVDLFGAVLVLFLSQIYLVFRLTFYEVSSF